MKNTFLAGKYNYEHILFFKVDNHTSKYFWIHRGEFHSITPQRNYLKERTKWDKDQNYLKMNSWLTGQWGNGRQVELLLQSCSDQSLERKGFGQLHLEVDELFSESIRNISRFSWIFICKRQFKAIQGVLRLITVLSVKLLTDYWVLIRQRLNILFQRKRRCRYLFI